MASKKDGKESSTGGLTALKIGSRVRCTDDGVQGRITWANGISVKVQWDDGEQVTWRRDTLASRPIDILPSARGDELGVATPEPAEQGHGVAIPEPANDGAGVATELPYEEMATARAAAAESTPEPELPLVERVDPAAASAAAESAPSRARDGPRAAGPRNARSDGGDTGPAEAAAEDAGGREGEEAQALDAAAKVLAETDTAMACQEMIVAMAQKGYWTSPGGKTPAATLASAVLREITTKGSGSRFVKVQRGKFGRSGVA